MQGEFRYPANTCLSYPLVKSRVSSGTQQTPTFDTNSYLWNPVSSTHSLCAGWVLATLQIPASHTHSLKARCVQVPSKHLPLILTTCMQDEYRYSVNTCLPYPLLESRVTSGTQPAAVSSTHALHAGWVQEASKHLPPIPPFCMPGEFRYPADTSCYSHPLMFALSSDYDTWHNTDFGYTWSLFVMLPIICILLGNWFSTSSQVWWLYLDEYHHTGGKKEQWTDALY